MTAEVSRQGRHKQRYSATGAREVGVAVIFAKRNGGVICVACVSCRKHPEKMTFPKGGWENDESVVDCAIREAFEEGGLRSVPFSTLQPVLSCTATGGKSGHCNLHPVVLRLVEEVDVFPEAHERERLWVPVQDIISGSARGLKSEFHGILGSVDSEIGLAKIADLLSKL